MNIIKKLILRERASSEEYIKYLKKRGVEIGEDVVFFRPFNTTIDVQNPHLLTIGNHVMITGPVTVLTHDYSWCVIKRKYGVILGNQRKTQIGDNVFIGWGATILAGSIIGNNVIIGAGSIVSGHCENDSVYAGNPARRIMSLDEYFKKRKAKQFQEAVDYILEYNNRFGEWPDEQKLDEYFFLFSSDPRNVDSFSRKMKLMMNEEVSYQELQREERQFGSYEQFLEYVIQLNKD